MLETLEAKLIGLGVVVLLIALAFGGGVALGNNHGYKNGYKNGYGDATTKLSAQITTANANAASANAAVAAVRQQLQDNATAAAQQAAAAAQKVALAQQAQSESHAALDDWVKKYDAAIRTPADQKLLKSRLPADLQDY